MRPFETIDDLIEDVSWEICKRVSVLVLACCMMLEMFSTTQELDIRTWPTFGEGR
jgi:hypothetical protein